MQFQIPSPLPMGQYRLNSSNGNPIDGMYPHGQYLLDLFSDATCFQINNHSNGASTNGLTVVNYTNEPITYIDHWNCLVTVPPCEEDRGFGGCVVVEHVHSKPDYSFYSQNFGQDTDFDEQQKFYNEQQTPHDVRSIFYIDVETLVSSQPLNVVTWMVIDNAQEKLNNHGGCFYLEDFDICIGKSRLVKKMVHPRSTADVLATATAQSHQSFLSIQLFINDPTYKYSKKFVKLGMEIYEIPIKRMANKEEGVYIVERDYNNRPITRRYSIGDKDLPFVLHDSRSCAEHENNSSVLEKETQRLKLEMQNLKAKADLELIREKEVFAREEAARKAEERIHEKEKEIKRREAEISEQIKRKRMAEKEAEKVKSEQDLEKKAQFRKALIEYAKLATTLITTATTLYAWFKIKKAG